MEPSEESAFRSLVSAPAAAQMRGMRIGWTLLWAVVGGITGILLTHFGSVGPLSKEFLAFILLGFYLPFLLVAVPLVELALNRWLGSESSRIKLVLRCLLRGAAYSPVIIGFGHGTVSFPLVLALPLFIIADAVFFFSGIPFATLTLVFLMISCVRWIAAKQPKA
jgi:hypothetical protein